MPEDLTTKITDVRPQVILDPKTGFAAGIAVDFMVGSHGPYTLRFPQAGYTAAAMKAAVEAQAKEIRASLT